MKPRAEDLLELVRSRDLELIVPAILGPLVGPPAQKKGGVAETLALQMVVLHFADPFDADRLPRQILARAPATLSAGHPRQFPRPIRPFAPGMMRHRILAKRRE